MRTPNDGLAAPLAGGIGDPHQPHRAGAAGAHRRGSGVVELAGIVVDVDHDVAATAQVDLGQAPVDLATRRGDDLDAGGREECARAPPAASTLRWG